MNENLIAYLVAYLIGAVPFGLLFGLLFGGVNIKKSGSKSIGATNVLRVIKESNPALAKKLAILTVVFDALKGVVPILVGRFIFDLDISTLWAMGVLAVVGHCFSPYLMFEGGKGIATGAGVLACFLPFELIIAVIVWFIVGKASDIAHIRNLLHLRPTREKPLPGRIIRSKHLFPEFAAPEKRSTFSGGLFKKSCDRRQSVRNARHVIRQYNSCDDRKM
ncbi:MAG: glycerol-3-phosphate acyltransferase, partial [Campylobacter sp.]|nr:glycerol-3-phosphate acyltransferase [Campylobacter sp.]